MADGKWLKAYTNTSTQTPDLLGGLGGFLLHGIYVEGSIGGNTFSVTLDGTVVINYVQAAGQGFLSKDWTTPLYSSANPVFTVSGASLTYYAYYSIF